MGEAWMLNPRLKDLSFSEFLKEADDAIFRDKRSATVRERRLLLSKAACESYLSTKGFGFCGISFAREHPCAYDLHHPADVEKKEMPGLLIASKTRYTEKNLTALIDELSKCKLLTSISHSYLHRGFYRDSEVDSEFIETQYRHHREVLADHLHKWKNSKK